MFLRPSLDIEVIHERHATAAVFLRPGNEGLFMDTVKSLKQVKNIRAVLIHLRKGVSNGASKGGGLRSGVWSSLRSVCDLLIGLATGY